MREKCRKCGAHPGLTTKPGEYKIYCFACGDGVTESSLTKAMRAWDLAQKITVDKNEKT